MFTIKDTEMKLKLIISIFLLNFLATGCEEKIYDFSPRASLDPASVSSPQDVERLLIGAYDGLQGGTASPPAPGVYYLSFLTEDLSADNLTYRATFFQHGEINDNAILVSNVLVQRYWAGPYLAIYRANEILKIIENIDASAFTGKPTRKAEIIAEASYIRAYSYYRLVTLFGGVPVLTTNTIAEVPRNTEDEVWIRIESDLDAAIAGAASFTDPSFISREAAKALRARVALIRGNNQLAKTLAEEVIAFGEFALAENYADIWALGSNGAGEMIFQLNFTEIEGQSFASFFLLDQSTPAGAAGGRFELPVDPNLVAAYENGDERRAASIAPARSTFHQAIKYKSGGVGDDPWPVSRIAEMYLISAEASAKISNSPADGMARVNEVRAKRNLPAAATPADLDAFITLILQERRVEFAFESLRWTDLKRTGRAIDVLPGVTNANQLLYPIPQTEIDVNRQLEQNPGY